MFNLSRVNRFWPVGVGNHWQTMGEKSSEAEDSISLRLLVLVLVILGIVATDIAGETLFSVWTIPLTILGTAWSYYRRRSSNIPVQFGIAMGMLLALGAFFGRFIGNWNDTRLSLAELLIQLQVLHGFDTPRRKDLGYSIVIGLILVGVAATLSQTMAFAPMLLLFLGVALPTLVLDYRSRLGFKKLNLARSGGKNNYDFNFKLLILNFLLIVSLGLGIFAILPRFPGYQLQSFPMSAPIKTLENFTGRSIINPGYVRPGKNDGQGNNSNGNVGGTGNTGEPGRIDNNFYYGFNSEMNQNLRGEMKPKVVMRVRSQAAGFWRVLAFDRYTGKGWQISRNEEKDITTLRQSSWSSRISLDSPLLGIGTKEVVQTYNVVSELPNLIPAMSYPKWLYFPTPLIAVDQENGLRAPVQLSEGLTYTVVSDVPYRDRSLLAKATTKYPAKIKDYYLQIPPAIAEKVRQRTEEILAMYDQQRVSRSPDYKRLDSTYEKALYLAQYIKQNYSLPKNPLDLPYFGKNDDLVESFLFKNKGGYPDHFSTVLTVMLRSIGIPSRLVAGFAPGEFNPFTGMYIVRNTDAYAMTEVYFPQYGWFTFDPIPGHPLIPPSIEEDQTFSVLRQFWNWIAGWLPSPVTGILNTLFGGIFSWLLWGLAWFLALFTKGWLGVLTGLIVGTIAGFLGWLSWGQWCRFLNRRWLKKLPPMERLYQQMLQWSAKKGLGKHPSQTPLEYIQFSYQYHSPEIAVVIDEICHAYMSWRYGGHSPNHQQLEQKWRALKKDSSHKNGITQ
ncbi:MAG: transglutaminaseTgpA domain-containing protein [Cuspidothrix sp.]